ncbi:MAG TPA: geranylgeranyl reductase family protein [Tessaracoccus flavescens]|uniref:Geranylgeranyl reductase family protein n=1 Tax=Tessaracoccus flavescens TaxID=399497 RepID=A0A921JQT2_9ACTN|nr:geranylgeranyl reductase family protein [Tessaracoccus flavescens]
MPIAKGDATTAQTSDVVVVGAGPGGATTAAYLARHGLTVTLLEKATFPRDKVCGDGLTPRATRALTRVGIDLSDETEWHRNIGLRSWGVHPYPFEFKWPDLTDFPPFGVARARKDFDEVLARHAVAQGATLIEGTAADEPILNERTGFIEGVVTKDGRQFRAPYVVAADGVSSRLAVSMGITKREDRPMGVAYRTYYKTPKGDDDHLESYLTLWDGEPHKSNQMPGYGWMFPLGNGLANVGLGILNTTKSFQQADLRGLLKNWTTNAPEAWGFRDAEEVGKIQGAALPMAFNRTPHYGRGLLLVGDAGGMVSPFNGEGIAYAMEAAEVAASAIAEAISRGVGTRSAERAMQAYPAAMKESLGGYYRLGITFSKLIGDPRIMHLCVKYGLPRKTLMNFVMKLLAHLTDARDGDAIDRIINALCKVAPSA